MPPRPPKGSYVTANQHAYIPAGAQQALARQMQQAVPAHLKQYVNNSSGYVPPRVQQELTTYMEAALPQHLQQYAGAYVEQNVVMPSMMQRPGSAQPSSFRPPKTINPRNLSHSANVGGEQADANQLLGLFQPDHQRSQSTNDPQPSVNNPVPAGGTQPMQQPAPALASSQPTASAAPTPPMPDPENPPQYPAGQLAEPYQPSSAAPLSDPSHYDFIMNPQASSPKPKLSGTGGGSFAKRIAVIAAIGIGLIVALVMLSSLLKGGNPSQAALLTVAQDQTELLRVAAQVSGHSSTPSTLQLANSVTINMQSAQNQTLAYMKRVHLKASGKQLALKHNAQTDTTLNQAVATNTFDKAFQQIMQSNLTEYATALQQAYNTNPGPTGRALLKNQHNGAILLVQQSQQS